MPDYSMIHQSARASNLLCKKRYVTTQYVHLYYCEPTTGQQTNHLMTRIKIHFKELSTIIIPVQLKFLDLVALVISWVSSNNYSSFLQISLGQVTVNDCPAGLVNWPHRGQKQEKSYCDYLKKIMISSKRRGPNFFL